MEQSEWAVYSKKRYIVDLDIVAKRREGFFKHSKMRSYNILELGLRIAVDVLLPFETNLERPLTSDYLLNGET